MNATIIMNLKKIYTEILVYEHKNKKLKVVTAD